jgi:hypothetical protein
MDTKKRSRKSAEIIQESIDVFPSFPGLAPDGQIDALTNPPITDSCSELGSIVVDPTVSPVNAQCPAPGLNELGSIPFEFDLNDFNPSTDGTQFDPPVRFQIIAGDSCGGVYISVGDGRIDNNPVFHLSSEGFASRLGSSLKETLEHVVDIPNWQDVANRNLDVMRERLHAHAPDLQKSFPGLKDVQERLRAEFGLESHEDFVQRLHESIVIGEKTRILINGQVAPSAFWPS